MPDEADLIVQKLWRQPSKPPCVTCGQNGESSRETELVETYPVHVVTAWLGNTASVAGKHYLQTTEEHLDKAVQNPVQQASARLRNALLRAPDPTKKPSKTLRTNVFEGDKLPRRDSNPN